MADNPITVILPADLPEDWEENDIVAPNGTDAGMTEQHGYNYLMEQVNAAQTAASQLGNAFQTLAVAAESLSASVQVTYNGGEN